MAHLCHLVWNELAGVRSRTRAIPKPVAVDRFSGLPNQIGNSSAESDFPDTMYTTCSLPLTISVLGYRDLRASPSRVQPVAASWLCMRPRRHVPTPWLRASEAAEHANQRGFPAVTTDVVRNVVRGRGLPAYTIGTGRRGTQYRINIQDLDCWLDTRLPAWLSPETDVLDKRTDDQ